MDAFSLLKEVSGLGIDSLIVGAVLLLYVRYSASETRREISDEIDDKLGAFKNEVQQSFQEVRQEIRAVRTYAERSHQETRQEIRESRTDSLQEHQATRQEMKDIMLHLIDVRERLANIEGRLGAPTPRMSGVSPPLEAPTEEPSTQS